MKIIIHEENREGILKNIPQIKNGICAEIGVNPAINEFCIENNYELNITNEISANWWIVKK
jgi:hypothetical protein